MKTEDITIHPVLSSIFPIQDQVLLDISLDMRDNGFDQNCPLILTKGDWTDGKAVIIDGHTRFEAARSRWIQDIPVVWRDCPTLGDAVTYAITLQKNRRNLTSEEMVACIETLLALPMDHGGDRRSKNFKEKIFALKNTLGDIAQLVGVTPRYVQQAKTVLNSNREDLKSDIRTGKRKIYEAYDLLKGRVPRSERTQKRAETIVEKGISELTDALALGELTISGAAEIAQLKPELQKELLNGFTPQEAVAQARLMNEQNTIESVDMQNLADETFAIGYRVFTRVRGEGNIADWVWNPITGCEEGCEYCYAKWQAHVHYAEAVPEPTLRFKPRLRREMLTAPLNTQPPNIFSSATSAKVICCDMGDMLGDWVPADWINEVITAMKETPHWQYLLTTTNPERFLDFNFPKNVWLGATANTQERVDRAAEVFSNLYINKLYLQIEPFIEPVSLDSQLDNVSWVIVGARTRTQSCEPKQPQWDWVWQVTKEVKAMGIPIFWKKSIRVAPQEFPI